MRYLRGSYNHTAAYRFDWSKMLRAGCYYQTHWGPVPQSDGELIFDNLRFVRRATVLSEGGAFGGELATKGTGLAIIDASLDEVGTSAHTVTTAQHRLPAAQQSLHRVRAGDQAHRAADRGGGQPNQKGHNIRRSREVVA